MKQEKKKNTVYTWREQLCWGKRFLPYFCSFSSNRTPSTKLSPFLHRRVKKNPDSLVPSEMKLYFLPTIRAHDSMFLEGYEYVRGKSPAYCVSLSSFTDQDHNRI